MESTSPDGDKPSINHVEGGRFTREGHWNTARELLLAPGSPNAAQSKKKARSSRGTKRAQLSVRRCGNCGEPGHYATVCVKDTKDFSESKLSEPVSNH